jgi:hypothetical protein
VVEVQQRLQQEVQQLQLRHLLLRRRRRKRSQRVMMIWDSLFLIKAIA